jgi:hypothetical protein
VKRYIKHFKEEEILQKQFLYNYNGYDVYTVNGAFVKVTYKMDFVEGGHFKVYNFIPENEIWVDNNIDSKNWGYIAYHEYIEVEEMINNNLDYNSAHEIANKAEKKYREVEDGKI